MQNKDILKQKVLVYSNLKITSIGFVQISGIVIILIGLFLLSRLSEKKEDFKNDSTLYIASINKKGEFVFLGNKFVDDYIEAKTNTLGIYLIAKDTVVPMIKPVNFKEDSSVTENWSLRVEIDDRETGINKYEMLVNEEWVIAEYDAKNKLLIYQIDSHIKKGHNTFKVIVTDMVGNETVYQTILQR